MPKKRCYLDMRPLVEFTDKSGLLVSVHEIVSEEETAEDKSYAIVRGGSVHRYGVHIDVVNEYVAENRPGQ